MAGLADTNNEDVMHVHQISSYVPNPTAILYDETSAPTLDDSGSMQIRGQVISDEGSFRDDFSENIYKSITGTLSFTNGSTRVTGTGTSFTTEILPESFLRRAVDSENTYEIDYVSSDDEMYLVEPYAGSTSSGTALNYRWVDSVTGGSSYSVSSSKITLSSSTASGNSVELYRNGDYLPYTLEFKASITQRIANQYAYVGFVDPPLADDASKMRQVIVLFDGTDNTKVKFRTSSFNNASDIETTTCSLPYGLNTSQDLIYTVDIAERACSLLVNNVVLATHTNHIPSYYDHMHIEMELENTGVASSNTNFSIEYLTFQNIDRVAVKNDFFSQAVKVQLVGRRADNGLLQDLLLDEIGNMIITPPITGSGTRFGELTQSATTRSAVRKTTYTEPTDATQRSIASSSANDTAAGTGARTVLITYYDNNCNGPYTETLTLNGTSRVNTIATNIRYIERIEVITAGSGAANAGTITLYTTPTSGGSAIATIAAGDNQTFFAHHYIPAGKTCFINGITFGHSGTVAGSGALFSLFSKSLVYAENVLIQESDALRLYGQSSAQTKTYASPLRIQGAKRIEMYVTPESTSSLTYRASFDFYEP